MLSATLGGLGLFLLGLVLLSDGLKAVAGAALRAALARFTDRPWRALLTGTVLTTLVQSSTATTVMTIGFVNAGLMTFGQAVGVIFGANIGSTSTGWIVSVIGLKVSLGAAALPVVGVGALLRIVLRGRGAALGLALAGFGLMFLGLDTLQAGMKGLSGALDPAALPSGATVGGRAVLFLFGLLMVFVLQSSGATVAATITALHLGTIDLTQATSLVIGQNVGTTATAVFAAIGGPAAVKRTAAAHFLFNAFTAVVVFCALGPFTAAVQAVVGWRGPADDATVLAAFHTGFSVLGVLLLFPVIHRFAGLIERLLPERGPTLTRHLGRGVSDEPTLALEATRRTLAEVAALLVSVARRRLEGGAVEDVEADLDAVRRALDETRRFVVRIGANEETAAEHAVHVSVLQALDHLERLARVCAEPRGVRSLLRDGVPAAMVRRLVEALGAAGRPLEEGLAAAAVVALGPASIENAEARRGHEPALLGRTAAGRLSPDQALEELEETRWVDRLGYHAWQAARSLEAEPPRGPRPAAEVEAGSPPAPT
jgi:phosphate:Na+ symporter